MDAFSFSPTPHLHFGTGKISVLSSIAKQFGTKVLLITGARSFHSSDYASALLNQLNGGGLIVEQCIIEKEPTPAMVDTAVMKFSAYKPDVLVAIGGGSVLDAGKAISAMIPLNTSVKDYLEGVGLKLPHPGMKIPYIAIPTTSGTGSEATKNAVLSEIGPCGFKRSLRHNNFVPNVAIIDPMLSISCPPSITAASGMDAFTQLLESYLSTTANPITDALAYEGLKLVSTSLLKAYHEGDSLEARTNMALASYLSGITLANAGLGLVHGFASSIGGYFDISHGVICSSLMAAVNTVTVQKLLSTRENQVALHKYATIGKLFSTEKDKSEQYYYESFLEVIRMWTNEMNIPTLAQSGVRPVDYDKIIQITDNKNNPTPLNADEMREVLYNACNRP